MFSESRKRKFQVFISLVGGFAACYVFRQRSQPPIERSVSFQVVGDWGVPRAPWETTATE